MAALEVVGEVPLLIGETLGCVGVGVEQEYVRLDVGGVDMDLGPGSAVWVVTAQAPKLWRVDSTVLGGSGEVARGSGQPPGTADLSY